MPKLSTQPDDVHVIREVHLHYSQDHQEQAPLKDSGDVAAFLRGVVKRHHPGTRGGHLPRPQEPPARLENHLDRHRRDGPRQTSLGLAARGVARGQCDDLRAQSSFGRSRAERRRQEVGRDALRSLYAAWPSASRQHHLDRGRKHELRALRARERERAMKDIRQGSLFEDSHESKRWHRVHAAPASGRGGCSLDTGPFVGVAKEAIKKPSASSPIGWRSVGTSRKAGRPRPLKRGSYDRSKIRSCNF